MKGDVQMEEEGKRNFVHKRYVKMREEVLYKSVKEDLFIGRLI
jgi:hypothetical protein